MIRSQYYNNLVNDSQRVTVNQSNRLQVNDQVHLNPNNSIFTHSIFLFCLS